jgi:hypothetical protein
LEELRVATAEGAPTVGEVEGYSTDQELEQQASPFGQYQQKQAVM